jgi:hypothetical protein
LPPQSQSTPFGRDRGATSAPGPAAVSGPTILPLNPASRSDQPDRGQAPGGLIPIESGPKPLRQPAASSPSNPFAFWDRYYQTHNEKPVSLLETVTYLGRSRKFQDVEAAITGYLRHHSKNAESWMYASLAVAYDANKRGAEKAKTALGYAAFLAKRGRKLDGLTQVADLLFLRGYYQPFEVKVGNQTETVGVGPLVDLAAELAPQTAVPPMMSVNLAQKTKDPQRMTVAIERLLSLGWPDIDDTMRAQAHRAVETLEKTLREDDRKAEADDLLARLSESEGRDLYVRLSWAGEADLDLLVKEPLADFSVGHELRRSVFGGSLIKEGVGNQHSEEIYVCPRAFDGDYTIKVDTVFNSLDTPVAEATVDVITREGLRDERKETHSVSLANPTPIVVHVTGGRRKTVLPFVAPPIPPAQVPAPAAQPAAKQSKQRTTPATPQNKAADALGTTPVAPPRAINPGAGTPPRSSKP